MYMNQFSIFEYLCSNCNNFECNCYFSASAQGQSSNQELLVSLRDNNAFDTSLPCSGSSQTSASEIQNVRKVSNTSRRSKHKAPLIPNHKESINNSFNLSSRGLNIGHLNIQGICGENLNKFSELKVLLTLPENNNLHILGLSETKLKSHRTTDIFKINGFQTPFRKDNDSNGGGGLLVYVKNGINAKRREDLETQHISCLWLEISPAKSKPFLVGNMYRPPDSKVEFNDRFEEFIDSLLNEDQEFILLGDFNKDVLDIDTEREWGNFTTSLGLTQLVNEPTRVTNTSQTLIDHIYTNTEENIQRVHVERLCLSDHYGVFCNRKSQFNISKNSHQIITYRSFRNFEENRFLNDLYSVPWEIIEQFDNLDDIVSSWNALLLEVLDRHVPIRHHRIKKKYQPDWLTPEIMDLMKERNKCKINGNMDDHRYLRNKVSKHIEMAKKNTYQSKIEGRSDPKTIWKIFKELGANRKDNSCE